MRVNNIAAIVEKKHLLSGMLVCGYILFMIPLNSSAQSKQDSIYDLQTEYVPSALEIDAKHPRFSWKMQSNVRGAAQKAYQIIIKNEAGQTVWNTGKIADDRALNIVYEGSPLQPQTRYFWMLSVWDQEGKKMDAHSWFETGLMPSRDTPANIWNKAQWIGG